MREIPLLMNGPMVRATLAGHKTNTRREIIRIGGFGKITQFGRSDTPGYDWHFRDSAMRWHDLSHAQLMKGCPYGQVGARLWVRETWRGVVEISHPDAPVKYGVARYVPDQQHCRRVEYAATQAHDGEPWRPNIHMPRWACRILLEVTGVRVERLQDISERDAVAEGVTAFYCGPAHDVKNPTRWGVEKTPLHESPTDAFCYLWEGISGAGSWDANPWVWAIEFRRVK
ncbi:hypothetical protein RJO15_07705 [Herbaspirillum huttiense F1]|uniref:hypothetical protein n=1 Tax=Herbaspirillum huttiense TaxID=863372 RepID=UPI002884BBFE|nr:hypothetical protein [Herbaspirillum huttiense]MDT0355644.1 hypothetical protein [Herbaspirillum huttiense F1]